MSSPKQILSNVLTQNTFAGVNIWEVVDPRMVLWFDKIEWGLLKKSGHLIDRTFYFSAVVLPVRNTEIKPLKTQD